MVALLCFFLTLFASLFKLKSRLEAENAALRSGRRYVIPSPDQTDEVFGPWGGPEMFLIETRLPPHAPGSDNQTRAPSASTNRATVRCGQAR